MKEGISGAFIRHPVATTLIMVAILFAGIVAYPLRSRASPR
jgi:multidrug efflux pump subunit AcrB